MGSMALEQAEMRKHLELAVGSGVEALTEAIDMRDHYTWHHSKNVMELAGKLGERLGLDEAALAELAFAARLHDVGKVGVPDAILFKTSALTEEEYALVRRHPVIGSEILRDVDFLGEGKLVVRHHHERWDGEGYPDGTSGEDIPVEARIVLVCDAFHAMTTDRPYRKRLGMDEAYRRLREGAGTQFDPAVVEVFLSLPCEAPVPVERVDAERLAS
jgi:ribonuclease P protein subunit RPR2